MFHHPLVDSLVDLAVDSAMENRPRHCVEELHAQDLGQGKVLRVVRKGTPRALIKKKTGHPPRNVWRFKLDPNF